MISFFQNNDPFTPTTETTLGLSNLSDVNGGIKIHDQPYHESTSQHMKVWSDPFTLIALYLGS